MCICFVLVKLGTKTSSLALETEVVSLSVPFIRPVVFDLVVKMTSGGLMYSFSDVIDGVDVEDSVVFSNKELPNPSKISSEEACDSKVGDPRDV